MSKDLWIAAHEEVMQELIEAGMDEDEAYEKAADLAQERMRENLFGYADYLRKKQKEGP